MVLAQAVEFDFDDGTQGAAEATQRALIDTQQRMGMMLDIMPMGLLIHTEQGILFANQEACRMLDAEKDQLIGQHVLDFVDASESAAVQDQMQRSFTEGAEVISEESLLRRGRGAAICIKLISARLPWVGTPVIQMLFQDVSDLKIKERALERLSTTDELTGAYNRRHVFAVAAGYMSADLATTPDLSVLLLDVDHFKKINDRYGHGVGDQALISLAKCAATVVKSEAGEAGVFARVGGEEFLVMLPGMDQETAAALGEKMRRAVELIEIKSEEGPFGFSISLGVASCAALDTDFEKLVARADAALYEAKDLGRNRVVVAK